MIFDSQKSAQIFILLHCEKVNYEILAILEGPKIQCLGKSLMTQTDDLDFCQLFKYVKTQN